jgi:hypothetical protein
MSQLSEGETVEGDGLFIKSAHASRFGPIECLGGNVRFKLSPGARRALLNVEYSYDPDTVVMGHFRGWVLVHMGKKLIFVRELYDVRNAMQPRWRADWRDFKRHKPAKSSVDAGS